MLHISQNIWNIFCIISAHHVGEINLHRPLRVIWVQNTFSFKSRAIASDLELQIFIPVVSAVSMSTIQHCLLRTQSMTEGNRWSWWRCAEGSDFASRLQQNHFSVSHKSKILRCNHQRLLQKLHHQRKALVRVKPFAYVQLHLSNILLYSLKVRGLSVVQEFSIVTEI